MSRSKNPSPGTQLLAVLVSFLVGPIGALYLAVYLAPDGDFAQALSPLLTAATFFFGFFAWLGGAFLSLLTRSGRERVRSDQPPKGTFGFVLCGLMAGGIAGLLTGIGAPRFLGPAAIMFAYCMIYGYLLHRLAQAGYLPFMEDPG